MKEEYNYQEIMNKMNEVARIVDARGYNGAPIGEPSDRTKYRKLAKMYKYYSLNKEKFTEGEQKKIERGIVKKANGWIPFNLLHGNDGTIYSIRLFHSLNKVWPLPLEIYLTPKQMKRKKY